MGEHKRREAREEEARRLARFGPLIPEPDRAKYGHMPERLYWEMLEGEDPDDRAIREAHGIGYDVPYSDDAMCRNGCGLTYFEISAGKIRECEGPTMTTLWRKHILPLGTISWRDRELSFTPAYLDEMAAAFTDHAYEGIALGTDRGGRGFSNDPELIGGIVRSLEVVADGMEAVIGVNAEMDALLDADPDTPIGVRIIERYRVADGREFPVVLAGVYTTPAPVLTGLRPWTREPA